MEQGQTCGPASCTFSTCSHRQQPCMCDFTAPVWSVKDPPRPGSSSLEWLSSILRDRTDPIAGGKLTESSLNMRFPLRQHTFPIIPANNRKTHRSGSQPFAGAQPPHAPHRRVPANRFKLCWRKRWSWFPFVCDKTLTGWSLT